MEKKNDYIEIKGAKAHNLKDASLSIPRGRFVVITGLSGSGKSSLAFDTIYAEGQRRYMDTLSTYAKHFMGILEKPDVESITGLSPIIAIEQKTTGNNPRSTVGTITEIYDFLRLLYARASTAYSPQTGKEMVRYTDEQIVSLIMENYEGRKCYLLAPVVRGRKGHYKELLEQMRKRGYTQVRVDGELLELNEISSLDRYKAHFIELVIDRLKPSAKDEKRIKDSVMSALNQGKGSLAIMDMETSEITHYSKHLVCPDTGISLAEPAPHSFSFNSPQGYCPHCKGLGIIVDVTTFRGLDWPTTQVKSEADIALQKKELTDILDQLQAVHINTVIFQTRVRGNLIYPSDIEIWCESLTGKAGGNPGYDPLAFAIEECHKRGMELHAWMVAVPLGSDEVHKEMGAQSITKRYPHLCKRFRNHWYLNPGHPDSQKYLASLVNELLTRYDVDGVHLDYIRYPDRPQRFPDATDYRKYGKGKELYQWRRDNITRLVRGVYEEVKRLKPWVISFISLLV